MLSLNENLKASNLKSLKEFLEETNNPDDEDLIPIKSSLAKFDIEFFSLPTHEKKTILQKIIDDCSDYIEAIPAAERNADHATIAMRYPNLHAVSALEKAAYRLLTLKHFNFTPESHEGFQITRDRYHAKARWDLTKQIIGTGKGKALDIKHWKEYRLQGNNDLYFQYLLSDWGFQSLREVNKYASMRARDYLKDPEPLRVTFNDGKLWINKEGTLTLLDSNESIAMGELIYVIDIKGNMYVSHPYSSLKDIKGGFQHSSFLSGEEVLCAGRVKIKDGVLSDIDTSSGHYQPGRRELVNALQVLHRNGINLNNVTATDNSKSIEYNAKTYLQSRGMTFPKNLPEHLFSMVRNVRGWQGTDPIPSSQLDQVKYILELCDSKDYIPGTLMLAKELYSGSLLHYEKMDPHAIAEQLKQDQKSALSMFEKIINNPELTSKHYWEIQKTLEQLVKYIRSDIYNHSELVKLCQPFNLQELNSMQQNTRFKI